jgi:hypothetical protein
LLDLQKIGQEQRAVADRGAVLNLRYNSGDIIPGAWVRVRGTASSQLRDIAERNKRQAAKLLASGKEDRLHDVDRNEEKTIELLSAAFIEAAPGVCYRGEQLDSSNIAAALADPVMKDLLTNPILIFCAEKSNFPEATALTSATTSISTGPTAASPSSPPSPLTSSL